MTGTNPRYGQALSILLALTGASFAASFINLGALAIPVALAIAATKMSVVLAKFMHLRREQPSAQAGLILAVTMLILLTTFMCLDASNRAAFVNP